MKETFDLIRDKKNEISEILTEIRLKVVVEKEVVWLIVKNET